MISKTGSPVDEDKVVEVEGVHVERDSGGRVDRNKDKEGRYMYCLALLIYVHDMMHVHVES